MSKFKLPLSVISLVSKNNLGADQANRLCRKWTSSSGKALKLLGLTLKSLICSPCFSRKSLTFFTIMIHREGVLYRLKATWSRSAAPPSQARQKKVCSPQSQGMSTRTGAPTPLNSCTLKLH